MFDDRESTPGDAVHQGNELEWRQKFAKMTGHEMECIEETVQDMSQLMAKLCSAYGGIPTEEVIEKMGVEKFDISLRAILATKDCNCTNTHD